MISFYTVSRFSHIVKCFAFQAAYFVRLMTPKTTFVSLLETNPSEWDRLETFQPVDVTFRAEAYHPHTHSSQTKPIEDTQNSENDLFNPRITFHILYKYIKGIYSFGLERHLLRQDIVIGTDATPGCFKQNSFNIQTYI